MGLNLAETIIHACGCFIHMNFFLSKDASHPQTSENKAEFSYYSTSNEIISFCFFFFLKVLSSYTLLSFYSAHNQFQFYKPKAQLMTTAIYFLDNQVEHATISLLKFHIIYIF